VGIKEGMKKNTRWNFFLKKNKTKRGVNNQRRIFKTKGDEKRKNRK
jgi:hypothetical protein